MTHSFVEVPKRFIGLLPYCNLTESVTFKWEIIEITYLENVKLVLLALCYLCQKTNPTVFDCMQLIL